MSTWSIRRRLEPGLRGIWRTPPARVCRPPLPRRREKGRHRGTSLAHRHRLALPRPWLSDSRHVFGILFQYWAIKPMSQLTRRQALADAIKADTLSIIAFEVGLFGWMALAFLVVFPSSQPGPQASHHARGRASARLSPGPLAAQASPDSAGGGAMCPCCRQGLRGGSPKPVVLIIGSYTYRSA
jgi:hypothetical protein